MGILRHYTTKWATKDITVATFRPGLDRIIAVSGSDTSGTANIVKWLDNLLDDYAMNVINAFNVDIENASVTYVNENWVFIGAEVKAD